MIDDREQSADSEEFDLQKFIQDLSDLKPFRPNDRWLKKHVYMKTPVRRFKGSLDVVVAEFESLRADFEKQFEEKVMSQLSAKAELVIIVTPHHKTDGMTQEQIEFTADERWELTTIFWMIIVSDEGLYGSFPLNLLIFITRDGPDTFLMRVGKVDDFDAVREELLETIAQARGSSGQGVIEP